jgi:hypothetical protein
MQASLISVTCIPRSSIQAGGVSIRARFPPRLLTAAANARSGTEGVLRAVFAEDLLDKRTGGKV